MRLLSLIALLMIHERKAREKDEFAMDLFVRDTFPEKFTRKFEETTLRNCRRHFMTKND